MWRSGYRKDVNMEKWLYEREVWYSSSEKVNIIMMGEILFESVEKKQHI